MEPRVQYTRTSDGVSIAYWSIGEGDPIVFMPSMPLSHIEFEWRFPEWRAFFERFAERRRVVRYDGRGTGLSDRRAINYSLETLGLDLEAVLDGLGLERVTLFSAYLAGPAAISFVVAHPERIANLILWCSFPNGTEISSPTIRATRSLIDQDWEVYTQTAAHVLLGWNAGEAAQTFSRFIAEANSNEGVAALFQAAAGFDVTDQLSSVRPPTLVMQRRGISWLSLDLGRELAAGIPNARLAVLEGESIAPFMGDVDSVVNATFDFLGDSQPERRG
ncbi:MAG TPA: alpha/beta hydrolase, partial [Dehalococcoidia bacterium]